MKPPKKAKTELRDEANDLIAVMQRYNLTLPRNAIEWRTVSGKDGEDIVGDLPGITQGSVRVLCTDGLLAWFVLGDGRTTLFGHLANLRVDRKDRGTSGSAKRDRESKPRKSVRLAIESLNNLLDKL